MERVVDEIGGIVVDVKAPIKDDQYPTEDYRYTRAYFATGPQEMDGVQAVRYARTRHDDNDFKRSQRQQEMLLAIRNQVLVSGVITKLPQLISEVGDSVRTDLSPRQVLSLARFGQDLPRDRIFSHSINGLLYEEYIDQEFFFVADWYSVRNLVQNLPENIDASNNPGSGPPGTTFPEEPEDVVVP
jgi:anionic cell wall polymer biosynthesis LytR-Cps2A-Psr (LCP) family protein